MEKISAFKVVASSRARSVLPLAVGATRARILGLHARLDSSLAGRLLGVGIG